MDISTSYSPFPKIAVKDWFDNIGKLQDGYKKLEEDVFGLKQEGLHVRNVAQAETEWSVRSNNSLLRKRYEELNRWRQLLLQHLSTIESEIQSVEKEKSLSEKEVELLTHSLIIVNECLALRDERKIANLCSDDVQKQLNNELRVLQSAKKSLSDKCNETWQQIVRLVKIKDDIKKNIEQKEEAMIIEETTLNLSEKYNATVSYKPVLEFPKYVSYESWLEECTNLKQTAEIEIRSCQRLKHDMRIPRDKARTEILSQIESTNFSFRKRIFEIRSALDGLHWQNRNLQQRGEQLLLEIQKLENALLKETAVLKVAESQSTNRIYRPGKELCLDACTSSLEQHVCLVQNVALSIDKELVSAKNLLNSVQEQMFTTDNEISNKTNALTVDLRCLEIRKKMLTL